jgi:heme/copper-type cytochrome/quinol oxidase subunit 2
MIRYPIAGLVAAILGLGLTAGALAEDAVRELRIKDHRFEPAELHVPAGVRVQIKISNRDATAEEFESHELNREKLIVGGKDVRVYVGPLRPGSYPFIGELNADSARGVIIAR